MLHPDKQALLNELERDPDDGSQSTAEYVDDILELLGDMDSGMIHAVDQMFLRMPRKGAPVVAQVAATCLTNKDKAGEIIWTMKAKGTVGNGYQVEIAQDAEVQDITISHAVGIVTVIVPSDDGDTLHNSSEIVTAVGLDEVVSKILTAALTDGDGKPQESAVLMEGGADITVGVAGAIRYEDDKIWISVEDSSTVESYWRSAALTDPNE